MPKVRRGRLSGVYGMASHTAAELYAWADRLDAQMHSPVNVDDPAWLARRVSKLRKLAAEKEMAKAHKDRQR